VLYLPVDMEKVAKEEVWREKSLMKIVHLAPAEDSSRGRSFHKKGREHPRCRRRVGVEEKGNHKKPA